MDSPLRGIALLIGATIFFSMSDTTAKYLTGSLPAIEIAWVRYIVFTLLAVSPLARGGRARVRTRRHKLQVLRGAGVVGSALLFILALAHLPIAQATTISFVSPLLIVSLSAPVLGEKVGLRGWLGVLVGFCGVLIVVRPGTAAFHPAALLVLGSAICWTISMLITRLMAAGERATATLLWTAGTGLLVLTLMLPFGFVVPGWGTIGLMLVVGVVASGGQWLTILAYRLAPASVLAPLSYLQLIWSTISGYLVFHAVPDGWTLVGAVVIAGSGLYTVNRERLRLRRAASAIQRTSEA